MKKIASIVLALVLVLAMAAPAMAADGYTITVGTAPEGHVYEAYQIFSGRLEANTLSDIEWGSGIDATKIDDLMTALKAIDAFANCDTAADVADKMDKLEDDADLAKKFADVVAQYLSTTCATSTETAAPYKMTVNEAGYYLVKDRDESVEGHDSYTRYILTVVKDVTVASKGTVPSVDKVIVEGENRVSENNASIGDTIYYEFTGKLPSNIADYDSYYYVFTDTMSKGLTYNANTVEVTVNGVDVTDYFYVGTAEGTDDDGNATTVLTVGMQDLLALELLKNEASEAIVGEITEKTTVVVTYNATLNENAEIGTDGNENKVDLEFSNDPNDDGDGATEPPTEEPETPTPVTPTGKTPEDKVYTYTTELTIKKVDENGNILTGAAFEITGDSVNIVVTTADVYVEDVDGEYWKLADGTYTKEAPVTAEDETNNEAAYDDVDKKYSLKTKVTLDTKTEGVKAEAFVNANGTITFTGLGAGTYTITETVVPQGYNSVDPSEVTIEWTAGEDGEGCVWTYEGTDVVNGTNINQLTITNVAGTILPSTGGIGTTIFYVAGGLLMVGALVLLITKRKVESK